MLILSLLTYTFLHFFLLVKTRLFVIMSKIIFYVEHLINDKMIFFNVIYYLCLLANIHVKEIREFLFLIILNY